MNLKTLLFALTFISTNVGLANETCHVDEPVEIYKFQDQILNLSKHVRSAEELQNKMAEPLKCLVKIYQDGDLLMKYVAGACLQRLMGKDEIPGFKRHRGYDLVANSLINQQLASSTLLSKSEIADLASGKWSDYVTFCTGSVTEALCSELLPTNVAIKNQSELLGATSMLVLKSAYQQFSGVTKAKIAQQLRTLYKETANDSPLKRKVIDQIYREMNQDNVKLRGS